MVWMRSRPGSCARRQPRACERSSAAAASWRSRSPCAPSGISPRSARRTRARISAAARRVKVIARISSGSSTTASSRNNRCVRTVVLPDPAGACRITERLGSIARSRASSSAWAAATTSALDGLFVISPPQPILESVILRSDETVTDTAYAGDVAVVTGPRLRIHHRLPGGKSSGQPLHEAVPFPDTLLPCVMRLARGGLHTRHLGKQCLADGDPVVSDLSRRDVDGRQGNHLFPDRREVSEQLRMGGPIAVPVGAHSPAALVVENREPAALERIEAIDAQAQLLARQAKARRVLRMPHAKGSASPLDLEQPCDEPRGAATLARQRWTRNRVLARGLECCRRLRDTGVEQLVELRRGERHQRTRVAELIPELLQSGVQQLAARIGRNARLWHAK